MLAQPVSLDDQDRLRALLRNFGALDGDFVYRGSSRAGWAEPPDATQPGKPYAPLDLRQILASDFWDGPMQFGELSTMAATMLQPVGGMDRIGQAFGVELAGTITYQAVVTRLRRTATGVRIIWRHATSGAEHRIDAPIVVITVPFPALADVDADFAPATRAAMREVAYVPAGKVAFQASSRFWELDQNIYGGISWTSRDATQLWYPSGALQHPKGILVGAYIWSEQQGNAFAEKPLPKRLSDTLDDVAHLHPQAPRFLGQGVSVAWKNIPFSKGAWAEWTRTARATQYPVLQKGDGPYLFAGEHMSFINGWQEGAVRSAHKVLTDIAERMRG
jgi:monoamine oxidase